MDTNSPQSNTKKPPEPKIKNLRTYEGDIQEAIQREQTSLTKIALAERERAGRGSSIGGSLEEKKSGSRRLVVIILILAVISGGGIALYFFLSNRQENVEAVQAVRPRLLIPMDNEREILLPGPKRATLIDALQKEAGSPLSISTMRGLFVKESALRYMDTRRFFRVMEAELPSQLSRTMLETLTLGIHAFDGNHLFLVFKADSYESAFAGMIAWESDLAQKFTPLFKGRGLQASEKKPFEDVVIKNKDARMLRDDDGRPLIIYSFLDRETILITDSEFTVEEANKRLTALKLKR